MAIIMNIHVLLQCMYMYMYFRTISTHINVRTCTCNLICLIHRLPGDQRVFRVMKGVTTFDYCHVSNILVTGGMDQSIRLWNPFVTSSPIGVLYEHSSPIFSIKLDSQNERIYSISNDNTIKVQDTA